ncbi:hypothetical protein [Pectinatus sottacetonis]|uniref:hypothetical protein n=1 Tax=Pectinatus sottacetonis TaxID=1002795 RepID=UPI0018C48B69|nr:hypothetical protein [Pectinatus sottacetonis]
MVHNLKGLTINELAKNKKFCREIDKILQKNPQLNKKMFSLPKEYKIFFKDNTLWTEIYCYKIALIFSVIETKKPDIMECMKKVLKKCYKNIYNYIAAADEYVSFDEFFYEELTHSFNLDRKDYPANIPQDFHCIACRVMNINKVSFSVFLLITNLLGKKFKPPGRYSEGFLSLYHGKLDETKKVSTFESIELNAKQKELLKKIQLVLKDKLQYIPHNLDELFSHNTMKPDNILRLYYKKYFSEFPFGSISNILISQSYIQEMLKLLVCDIYYPEKVEITPQYEDFIMKFIYIGFFSRACAKEYAALRSSSIKYIKKDIMQKAEKSQPKIKEKTDPDLREKKLHALEKELFTAKRKFAVRNADADKLIFSYKQQLKDSDKIIVSLRKKISSLQWKLKQCRVIKQVQIPFIDRLGIEKIRKELTKKKIVIIAGFLEWQQRIKVKNPEFVFISATDVAFDMNLLDNADIVVINVKHAGHSQTLKAKNYAKKHGKKYILIGNTNEKQLLEQIWWALNK